MSQVRARPPKSKPVIAAPATEAGPVAVEGVSARYLLGAASGLIAAWLAAGSTGLLGHPLRHALTWLAVIVTLLAACPAESGAGRRKISIVGMLVSILFLISVSTVVNVLGIALILASLAWSAPPIARRVFIIIASGALLLGIYRFAYTSIPAVWYFADSTGGALGKLAALLCRTPLSVGATFGGMDYLVAMVGMYLALLVMMPPPRMRIAVFAPMAILLVHLTYLMILAIAPTLIPPPPPLPPPSAMPVIDPKTPFSFVETIRPLVPWNLPAIAAILHAALAVIILRWTVRPEKLDAPQGLHWFATLTPLSLVTAATALAAFLPATNALYPHHPSLEGKKIVLFEKGFLNWLKPKHGDYGRLSIGMYGMVPDYLRSLGANVIVSPNLSDEDLKGANVVAFFFPNKDWEPGQLDRVKKFVESGGSMLVLGEHTTHEGKGPVIGDKADSRFNDLLAGSSMYVPFDSATFEIGGWLQSYEQMSHPTYLGLRDDRNQLGVVIGASVKAKLPAEPMIVGRWGYNDPGDDGNAGAMMGNHRFDPGERLGDILLAAEQRVGKGKVVVFGDTSGFTNGITYGAHVYTAPFWAYMADGPGTAHPYWRQILGLIAAVGLLGVILIRPAERSIAATALAMAASLTMCISISHESAEQLPDGRRLIAYSENLRKGIDEDERLNKTAEAAQLKKELEKASNNLAYITTSHLESSSEESWRPDGTMGMAMTLMRNGYLTLALPQLTPQRLERAAIVVCVGPQREFSSSDCEMIQQFVKNGGIFILAAGYDCHEAAEPLIKTFGFYIGNRPEENGAAPPPPEPMGHFKSPYINLGDYMPHVRFHAAWPIGFLGRDMSAGGVRIIANGPKNLPVMMARRIGNGTFVLVGDTGFVMNKNLEWEDGRPFDGMRENADFWRWFLTDLTDQTRWVPPRQVPQTQPGPGGGQ